MTRRLAFLHPGPPATPLASLLVAAALIVTGPALAERAADCAESRKVEARGSVGYADPGAQSAARQEAVRHALFEALQSAGGAEIARSAQTATRSTLSSIERETREHVVVRSDGRITGWTILDEQVEIEAGERTLMLTLGVDLCFDAREAPPLVVALADPDWDRSPGIDTLRPSLLEQVGRHDRLTAATDRPGRAYHDIAIEFEHAIEREAVDRRPQADILAQFGGGRQIAPAALEYDLLIVRATVRAIRFVDRKTIFETAERRARLATGASMDSTARDLAIEAYSNATAETLARLASGELTY